MARLILASGSPRRAKILAQLGLPFEVLRTDAAEVEIEPGRAYDRAATARVVEQNARMKLTAGFAAANGAAAGGILAADTVVWFQDRILGKPRDLVEAAEYLRMLSGRVHCVFTGVAYLPPDAGCADEARFALAESRVEFRPLAEETIAAYVARVRPVDRAGAYDIDVSGDLLVAGHTGEYENIMGLPVEPLRTWGLVTA